MTAAESCTDFWLRVVRLSPVKWSIPPLTISGCRCQKCISISECFPSGLVGFPATVSALSRQIPSPSERPNSKARKWQWGLWASLCCMGVMLHGSLKITRGGSSFSYTNPSDGIFGSGEAGLGTLHATVQYLARQGWWHREVGQMSDFRLPKL